MSEDTQVMLQSRSTFLITIKQTKEKQSNYPPPHPTPPPFKMQDRTKHEEGPQRTDTRKVH